MEELFDDIERLAHAEKRVAMARRCGSVRKAGYWVQSRSAVVLTRVWLPNRSRRSLEPHLVLWLCIRILTP